MLRVRSTKFDLLTGDPATPVEGQVWYNTTDGKLRYYDGSTVRDLPLSPGGSDTHVQFNDSGSLGGDSSFTWDKVIAQLDVNGDIRITADNRKLFLGQGYDASLYYDGSHFCFDPKEVGSGQLWMKGSIKGIDSDNDASGDGSLCFTYKSAGFKTIQASGNGSVVLGAATGSAGVTFEATGIGTIALGRCSGYDAHGKLRSTGSGSLACGYVGTEGTDALLESAGYGSIALGRSETNWTGPFPPNSATLISQGHGSVAGGYAQGYSGGAAALLKSSGTGSFAWGHAYGGTHQATGTASGILGKNLQATANYAFAFGRDFTNSVVDSFAVGWGQVDFRLTTTTMQIPVKTTAGDPPGVEGLMCCNTNNRTLKIYANGVWRTIHSW